MKLFHQLVKNNRIKGGNLIMDLNVGNNCYSGEENILEGFQHHFKKLASAEETCTQNDPTYHQNVEYEIQLNKQSSTWKKHSASNCTRITKCHKITE